MEDVTGTPFDEIMNRVELEPLQMSRSHFRQPPREEETDNMAHGYSWQKTLAYGGRFGAGVSNRRGWVIMTNAEKDRVTPILQAVVREFRWSE